MIKLLATIVGLALAAISATFAYRYSERTSFFIQPYSLAIMAAAVTLFFCMVVVVVLNKLGLYG